MTDTEIQIQEAKIAVDIAYRLYQDALTRWNNSSFFETLDGKRKRQVDEAKTALDEAQQNFQALTGYKAYEDGNSRNSRNYLPVFIAGIVAVIIIIYTLKR